MFEFVEPSILECPDLFGVRGHDLEDSPNERTHTDRGHHDGKERESSMHREWQVYVTRKVELESELVPTIDA